MVGSQSCHHQASGHAAEGACSRFTSLIMTIAF